MIQRYVAHQINLDDRNAVKKDEAKPRDRGRKSTVFVIVTSRLRNKNT